MLRESFNNPNQFKLNLQTGPETAEERIHRLGMEDHFRRVRLQYGIPENCKISYGFKTSSNKQILVDGEPLEAWYKNFLKNKKVD